MNRRAPVFGSPAVKRQLRDPVFPADFLVVQPSLSFLQDSDDLFFAKSLPFHGEFPSLLLYENSLSLWTVLLGGSHYVFPCFRVAENWETRGLTPILETKSDLSDETASAASRIRIGLGLDLSEVQPGGVDTIAGGETIRIRGIRVIQEVLSVYSNR